MREHIIKIADIAESKVNLLEESISRFFVLSIMAGFFVGIGVVLISTIGGLIPEHPFKNIILGLSFGIALSLVLVIGAELFTGNNFIMMIGSLEKKVKWKNSFKVWGVSYIGNLLGSILIAILFVNSGLVTIPIREFIINSSANKMSLDFMVLIYRGILCNILVCLAIFSYLKLENEAAKLMMISWCLFAFVVSGFEHSIANMTIFSIGLLVEHPESVSFIGSLNNLIPVTIGNFIGGGLFLGGSYWFVGNQ